MHGLYCAGSTICRQAVKYVHILSHGRTPAITIPYLTGSYNVYSHVRTCGYFAVYVYPEPSAYPSESSLQLITCMGVHIHVHVHVLLKYKDNGVPIFRIKYRLEETKGGSKFVISDLQKSVHALDLVSNHYLDDERAV